MKKSACFLLSFSTLLAAPSFAEPLNLATNPVDLAEQEYRFEDSKLGGFERIKVGEMKVRGWQIGKHTHFGQAKVNDKWGLGFVVNKGNTSYGVNHRGIEFSRRF